MTLWGALAGGFVGTIVLTSSLRFAQETGLTRMDIPLLLGTVFTASRSRANVIGYAAHFVNGLLFALVYYLVFRAVGHAGWLFGLGLGAVHALVVGRRGDTATRAARVHARELRVPDRDRQPRRAHAVRRDRRRLHRPLVFLFLAVFDLEREPAKPLEDGSVERGLVLLGGVLVQREGEVVA